MAHRSIIALILLASTALASSGQQPFVRTSDIRFKAHADHRTYAIGDQIVIHYTIKNVSNGALYVPARQWEIKCGSNPHLWSLLEDDAGRHSESGWGGSCGGPDPVDQMSVTARMEKDAILLRPGSSSQGTFTYDSAIFAAELKPGRYRLESVLWGWNQAFNDSQLSELAQIGSPFLIGEATASLKIQLRRAKR